MTVTQIGRYEIERELAQGGMGLIFLARDPYMHRQVVVKVLMYKHITDDMQREFFQNEAELIASLEHPCIVPVYDFGWHGKQPYIVMRYMSAGSLDDRLKDNGEIKLKDMAHIMKRVGEALDAAHAKNIIHRDVKPSNILFDSSGESFLSDFGIAKSKTILDDDGEWLVGTPAYMSPEQANGDPIDGCSDVYAMGIMLYRLLTGQLPFSSDSTTALLNAHSVMPIPDVTKIKNNIPAVWQEVITKAMAKDRKDRYQSAGEFSKDVEQVASGKWFMRKL